MLGFLVFYWLLTTPVEVKIQGKPAPELQALPVPDGGAVKPAKKLRQVLIELDTQGVVRAKSGEAKLAAFDATKKGKMQPLQKWLGKVSAREKVAVRVKVSGDSLAQQVTDLLNVFADLKITEITFADLPEDFEPTIKIDAKGMIQAHRGLIELAPFDSKGGKNLQPLKNWLDLHGRGVTTGAMIVANEETRVVVVRRVSELLEKSGAEPGGIVVATPK
jgi:hypothetical protein